MAGAVTWRRSMPAGCSTGWPRVPRGWELECRLYSHSGVYMAECAMFYWHWRDGIVLLYNVVAENTLRGSSPCGRSPVASWGKATATSRMKRYNGVPHVASLCLFLCLALTGKNPAQSPQPLLSPLALPLSTDGVIDWWPTCYKNYTHSIVRWVNS
jgi:hypothetical protein